MPNAHRLSSIFVFRTYDNSVLVKPLTLGYNFLNATVTPGPNGIVTVDVSGGAGGPNWETAGNNGAGLVHGTLTADDWSFISSGLVRGGFKFSGEFFLKTHIAYANSENNELTNAVSTVDDTLTTIFAIPVTDLTNNLLTVDIQTRRDSGADRAAFERKVMFWREGGGAVLSSKVHFIFTDKTQDGYDVSFTTSGNNVLVQVKGLAGQNLYWSGTAKYQGVKTSA